MANLTKAQSLCSRSTQVIATDMLPFFKSQLPQKKGKAFQTALTDHGLDKEDGEFIHKLRASPMAK
nr:hypothetical protein [Gammaproteobacteria bacterium]